MGTASSILNDKVTVAHHSPVRAAQWMTRGSDHISMAPLRRVRIIDTVLSTGKGKLKVGGLHRRL